MPPAGRSSCRVRNRLSHGMMAALVSTCCPPTFVTTWYWAVGEPLVSLKLLTFRSLAITSPSRSRSKVVWVSSSVPKSRQLTKLVVPCPLVGTATSPRSRYSIWLVGVTCACILSVAVRSSAAIGSLFFFMSVVIVLAINAQRYVFFFEKHSLLHSFATFSCLFRKKNVILQPISNYS